VREHFRALREKLEYEAQIGTLISRAQAEEAVFEAGRMVRDEIHASVGLIADEMAAQWSDLARDEAERIIRAHLTAALARVANALEHRDHALDTTAAAQP